MIADIVDSIIENFGIVVLAIILVGTVFTVRSCNNYYSTPCVKWGFEKQSYWLKDKEGKFYEVRGDRNCIEHSGKPEPEANNVGK